MMCEPKWIDKRVEEVIRLVKEKMVMNWHGDELTIGTYDMDKVYGDDIAFLRECGGLIKNLELELLVECCGDR